MTIDDIIDELDVLHDLQKEDYQELLYEDIQYESGGAVLIDGKWMPKSQLRCDFDKNLYISRWLYAKLF